MKATPTLAIPAAVVLMTAVILVGQRMTSDWVTIWLALTAVAASLSLAAAAAAALYAKGQIDTARTFQQINLTITFLTNYTPFILEMNQRARELGTWTEARDVTEQAINAGDVDAAKRREQVINVVSEIADLYASQALHPELLFRRADYSICLAWFMFENIFYSWGATQTVLIDSIKVLVKDAYDFLRKSRPAYAQGVPELRDFKRHLE